MTTPLQSWQDTPTKQAILDFVAVVTDESGSKFVPAPITRVGMASGTTDLQRDLGGALMQSIFGAFLAAGFATSMGSAIAAAPNGVEISDNVASQLELSYASAEAIAQEYPQYTDQIIAAAKTAFLVGDDKAYIAGIIAVVIGAALVFLFFPKHEKEDELLQAYHTTDTQS